MGPFFFQWVGRGGREEKINTNEVCPTTGSFPLHVGGWRVGGGGWGALRSPVLCNWRLSNRTLGERHARASVLLLPLKNIHSNSLLDQISVLIAVLSLVRFVLLFFFFAFLNWQYKVPTAETVGLNSKYSMFFYHHHHHHPFLDNCRSCRWTHDSPTLQVFYIRADSFTPFCCWGFFFHFRLARTLCAPAWHNVNYSTVTYAGVCVCVLFTKCTLARVSTRVQLY